MREDHRTSCVGMETPGYEDPVGKLQYPEKEDLAEHPAGGLSPGMSGVCGDP